MQWLLRFDRAPRGHSRARPLHAHVACTCTAHTCSCPHAATAGADAPSVVSHACLRLAHLGRESPCAKLPSAAARDGVHIRPAMKCGVPRSQACARVDVHPSVTQVVVTPALRRDHRHTSSRMSRAGLPGRLRGATAPFRYPSAPRSPATACCSTALFRAKLRACTSPAPWCQRPVVVSPSLHNIKRAQRARLGRV